MEKSCSLCAKFKECGTPPNIAYRWNSLPASDVPMVRIQYFIEKDYIRQAERCEGFVRYDAKDRPGLK